MVCPLLSPAGPGAHQDEAGSQGGGASWLTGRVGYVPVSVASCMLLRWGLVSTRWTDKEPRILLNWPNTFQRRRLETEMTLFSLQQLLLLVLPLLL